MPDPVDPAKPQAPSVPDGFMGLTVADSMPPRLVQSIGSRVWTDDGVEFIDFDNAGGAVLLGHRDPGVVAAVSLARSGMDRRSAERCRGEVADRIADLTPGAEACAFGANPGQALRSAVTVARTVTGRSQALVGRPPVEAGGARALGPMFRPDDLDALERLLLLHGGDTAAIVLAPFADDGLSQAYLARARALADRAGAVLIFDESLSGFRIHEGGAQALYGVTADLAVFGENIANGLPLGVLAGRRDLIEAVEASEPLHAEPSAIAAALAVLTRIEIEPVLAGLRIWGAEIQAEASLRLEAAGLDDVAGVVGDPAAGVMRFRSAPGVDARAVRSLWMNECLAHNVFTLGALNMSYAHGEREVAVLLAAFDQAADRLAMALRRPAPATRPAAQRHG